MASKFDAVEPGVMQRWYISVPFATVQCNTVQEANGDKRIVQIAPIFSKFEGKRLQTLLQWVVTKCDKETVRVELMDGS